MAIKKIDANEMKGKVGAFIVDRARAERISVAKDYLESLCPKIEEKLVFNAIYKTNALADKKAIKYLDQKIAEGLKGKPISFLLDGELVVVRGEEDIEDAMDIVLDKVSNKKKKKKQQEIEQANRLNEQIIKAQKLAQEQPKPRKRPPKAPKVKLKGTVETKKEIKHYLDSDRKKRNASEKIIRQKTNEIRRLQKYNQELEKKDKQPQLESPKTLSR